MWHVPLKNCEQKENTVLVADLDGTLLHPEAEAIPVLGRSGYRYMSQKSADLLSEISHYLPIVIATGRNAQSVERLVCQLPDVNFYGFVMENGFTAKTSLYHDRLAEDKWADVISLLPEWERLDCYENCLGLIFPSYVENPKAILRNALIKQNKTGYLYQERHKIFVYPSAPGKLSGIRALGADPLIAVGDEINDLDMLNAALYCGTLSTAHESIKQAVQEKNGYCAQPFLMKQQNHFLYG